ncbi:MAG: YbhB/YbcL family Raf kinase inhibitor-like protein [Ilumatobacteraceae bacterium]
MRSRVLLLVIAALVLGACGDRSGKTLETPIYDPPELPVVESSLPPEPTAPPSAIMPLALTASWVDGATVPGRQTCLGDGVSPALTWTNVPAGTIELAVTVVDDDAEGFVHWVVYAIQPDQPGLIEGQLPEVAFEWVNSAGQRPFEPLCPPSGETHRYRFTLYALNQQVEVADDAGASDVIAQLEATTIEQASVFGVVTTDP